MAFNLFDEATVADWKGKDLKQANNIPNIDILLLAVRKVCKKKYFSLFDVSPFDIQIPGDKWFRVPNVHKIVFFTLEDILSKIHFVYLQDNVEELSRVLDLHTGILGYISKFWRGFYPILVVELESSVASIEEQLEVKAR